MKKQNIFILIVISLFLVACAPKLGGDRDSHGCIGSAGYSWCEVKQKCLRVWEENCTENTQLANPASEYCEKNNGTLQIVTDNNGSQSGICTLKDGTKCDEWAYFRNECPVKKTEPAKEETTPEKTGSTVELDPIIEKYKQCVAIILPSIDPDYDKAEFEKTPGAEQVSLMSCLSINNELSADQEPFAGPIYSGQIIDAHNHFFYDDPVSDLIKKMDEANLDKIVILSGESLPLYQKYPDRIIPFYGSYVSDSLNSVASVAEEKLKAGYKGIGEINLRHAAVEGITAETKNPADSETMKKLADLSAKYGIAISVHHESNFDEIERLLAYNPNAKIILSHAGMGDIEVPFRMDRMMSKYPNLYADLSTRIVAFQSADEKKEVYYLLLPSGKINPIWAHVLKKHSNKFMIGGDYYVQDRTSLKKGTDEFRKVLGQLDTDTAEKIAYKNILAII